MKNKNYFRKLCSLYDRYFCFCFALICVIMFFSYYLLSAPRTRPTAADCHGYYSHLPAWFKHADVAFYEPVGGVNSKDESGAGPARNPYQVGVAVLNIPAFLVTELMARLFHYPPEFHCSSFALFNYPLDGYNPINEYGVALSGVGYGIVAVILLLRFLKREYGKLVAHVTILSILAGTNLLCYLCIRSLMTHIYTFFLVVLLIYATDYWVRQRMNFRSSVLLGIVMGFIALVRLPNVVYGLFPFLCGASQISEWRRSVFKRVRGLMIAMVFALVVFSFQLIVWHVVNGSIFVDGYTGKGEGFNWFEPQVLQVVFGLRKGMLFWFPILVLSVVGLFLRGGTARFNIGIAVVWAVLIYIWSSWWCWWFGGSLGYRPLVDILPILALPMGAFYAFAFRRFSWWGRGIVVIYICLCIFWSSNLVKRTVVAELSIYGLDRQCIYDVFYENYKYLRGEL